MSPRPTRHDAALLFLRLVVGARLVVGTLDNVTSRARMDEFAVFLAGTGVPEGAAFAAAVASVAVQFVGGLLLALGLFTRPVALVLALNFAVALGLAHRADTLEGAFPALVILAVALVLASGGPGALALDAVRASRRTTGTP